MKSNNRKRKNKSISLYVGLFNLILLIVITGHFTYEWNIVYNNILKQPFLGKGNILMVFTIFLIIFISMRMWGGFKLGYSKLVNLVFSQFLALITIGLGEFLIIALMAGTINHMGKLAGLIAVSAGIDFIFCVIYDLIGIRIYLMIFPPIRLLQVNGDYDNHLRTKISNRSDKYEVCEEISIYEGVDKIYTELEK